jgi:CheY-like chemotaxis protein/two-component sensor histidine kinase
MASKYKSEFLANMSHELRTPLNSLLILSRMLADNKEGNLTEEQTESATVIYNSGNDLLSLINEILDLSKIEAGRMEVNLKKVVIKNLADNISANFRHMLVDKGLSLEINVDENMPEFIKSDDKRLEQILKNLLSNAIKFTKKGGVTVGFSPASRSVNLFRSGLVPESSIAIKVTDTGIGIPADKQRIIFEAFQQADGSTSREYGGTGLGLSISRELASLLGGEIQVESEPGKGSSFTLYLPVELEKKSSPVKPVNNAAVETKAAQRTPSRSSSDIRIKDDREQIKDNKNVILIIEDDPNFAKLLMDQCHEKKYQALVALDGEAGLKLAAEYLPLAVILDLHLPGMDGWAVLDGLKENPDTRHIPVHIMSVDESSIEAFRKGAIGYLTKPAKKEELDTAFSTIEEISSKKIKNLLVIEDDRNLRDSVIKLIGNGDVHSKGAASGSEAMAELKSNKYDCMILDLGLPDMTGFELLKKLEEEEVTIPPVVVYTGRELNREEDMELRKYADSVIIKGVRSEERLLDETSLFLHRMVGKLPEIKKKMILNLYDSDEMFRGKKILLVDDDMRNVFALSQLLSQKGFKVLKAENGLKALEILDREENIDLVLMDIMMPELDGYETTKRIREQERFFNLPIIAFTAKAMKQDSEKCLAAGANDYMSKPVDINRMLSMMRVWLYR